MCRQLMPKRMGDGGGGGGMHMAHEAALTRFNDSTDTMERVCEPKWYLLDLATQTWLQRLTGVPAAAYIVQWCMLGMLGRAFV